jgi:hypothetical protein
MARIRLQAFPAQFTPTPFQNLAYMAEKRAARQDAIDESIGKTKGLFAGLDAAPGHEELAEGLSSTYINELNNLTEKFKNNYNSRDFTRELTALNARFINDRGVQTVVKSKEWYDKNGAALWDAQSKNYVVNAPGILDNAGNYKQNTDLYSYDRFKMTPWGDAVKEVQEQFNIQKEAKIRELGIIQEVQPDGTIKYFSRDRSKTYKDEDILGPVVQSSIQMLLENADSKPGFTYWNAKHSNLTPEEKSAEATRLVENASIPFRFLQVEDVTKPLDVDDGKGGDITTTSDKSSAFNGTPTNIALDAVKDVNGKKITSTQGLITAATESKKAVEANKGFILKTFPELTENDFIYTANGKEIDLTKIKDPQQKSRASELNMQYINSQRIADSHQEYLNYYMETSGYDSDRPISEQVDARHFDIANAAASSAVGSNPVLQSATGMARQGEIYTGRTSFKNREDFYQFVASNFGEDSPTTLEHMKEWDLAYSAALAKVDPRFADYDKKVTSYLNSIIYKQAYNINVESKDLPTLKNLVNARKNSRDITRANFGPDNRNRSQNLSAQEMEELLKNDELWKSESTSYTIRLDESTNRLVVDVAYGGEVYEVGGIDGLQEYVQRADPKFSAEYMQRENTFMDGLKQTSGRSSSVILYKPVMTSLGPSSVIAATPKVKSAMETIPGVVNLGDYMTKFPGLNDGNIIIAKSYWDLARLTESYNALLKVPGLEGDALQSKVNELFANPGQGITIVDGAQGKLNKRYFPGYDAPSMVLRSSEDSSQPSSNIGRTIVNNALNNASDNTNLTILPYSPSYGIPNTATPAITTQGGTSSNIKTVSQPSAALPSSYKPLYDLISAREASNYNTLFNNAEQYDFKGTAVTTMTLDDLVEFTKPGGTYDKYTREARTENDNNPPMATPLGKYQIVGTTLKELIKKLNLPGNTRFTPEVQDAMFVELVKQAISPAKTMSTKIERLRKTWEGFSKNKVPDNVLELAIKQIESQK